MVLGFVLRTAILWVLSLVVAVGGMEAAHRFVAARDRDSAAMAAMAAHAAASAWPAPNLLSALAAGASHHAP
jgi:hypothetical protein